MEPTDLRNFDAYTLSEVSCYSNIRKYYRITSQSSRLFRLSGFRVGVTGELKNRLTAKSVGWCSTNRNIAVFLLSINDFIILFWCWLLSFLLTINAECKVLTAVKNCLMTRMNVILVQGMRKLPRNIAYILLCFRYIFHFTQSMDFETNTPPRTKPPQRLSFVLTFGRTTML